MTNGRGFIALAALIFGRWHPLGAVRGGAAVRASALPSGPRSGRRRRPASWAAILTSIPEQVFAALPYIVTIIVLAGVVGRSIAPAAVGQPYERESTA